MAGRPAYRQSKLILADLDQDETLRESLLQDVLFGKPWRDVLVKRIHEDRACTWKAMLEWVDGNPEFIGLLDSAERFYAARMAHETIKIADNDGVLRDANGDPVMEDGKPVLIPTDVARDKLRVESRWKLASKLDKLKWADAKTDINVNIGGSLIAVLSSIDAAPALPEPGRVIEHEAKPAPAVKIDAPL